MLNFFHNATKSRRSAVTSSRLQHPSKEALLHAILRQMGRPGPSMSLSLPEHFALRISTHGW
jgi:hypothetical protein